MEDEEWEDVLVGSYTAIPDELSERQINQIVSHTVLVETWNYQRMFGQTWTKINKLESADPQEDNPPQSSIISKNKHQTPAFLSKIFELPVSPDRAGFTLYPASQGGFVGYAASSRTVIAIKDGETYSTKILVESRPQNSWGISNVVDLPGNSGLFIAWYGWKFQIVRDGLVKWTSAHNSPSPDQSKHIEVTDSSVYFMSSNGDLNRLDFDSTNPSAEFITRYSSKNIRNH